jgi:hypothetical protein
MEAAHAHRDKRTHTSANGQHKKRRNAANDANLDDLAMSEVNPLPESDTEFVDVLARGRCVMLRTRVLFSMVLR